MRAFRLVIDAACIQALTVSFAICSAPVAWERWFGVVGFFGVGGELFALLFVREALEAALQPNGRSRSGALTWLQLPVSTHCAWLSIDTRDSPDVSDSTRQAPRRSARDLAA